MADWEKGRKWFQREEVSSGKPGEESLKAHHERETWHNTDVSRVYSYSHTPSFIITHNNTFISVFGIAKMLFLFIYAHGSYSFMQ